MRALALSTFLAFICTSALLAQPTVPRMVRITSTFHPVTGSVSASVESVLLAIYSTETGGAPLWQEAQNVSVDSDGHYSVLLGSTSKDGLPVEMFSGGEPRW